MKLGCMFIVFLLCCPVAARAETHIVDTFEELQTALGVAVSNEEADTIILSSGEYDFSQLLRPLDYIPAGDPAPPENYSLTIRGVDSLSTIFIGASASGFFNFSTRSLTDDSRASISISGIRFLAPGNRMQILTTDANVDLNDVAFVADMCNDQDERILISSTSGDIMVSGSSFEAWSACSTGCGAELETESGEIVVVGNTFKGNGNSLFGPGLSVSCLDSLVFMAGNMFQDYMTTNMAQFTSGAVQIVGLDQCSTFIEDNYVFDNWGSYGGGIVFMGSNASTVSFVNNLFLGNVSTFGGGGVIVTIEAGSASFLNNRFWDNTAGEEGGAIYIVGTGESSTVFQNNVFSGNDAGEGGAVYSWQEQLTMTNNTIHSNRASTQGGGISAWMTGNSSIALIYNNIIWNNVIDSNPQDIFIDDDYDDKDIPSDGIGATVELFNNDFSQLIISVGDNLTQTDNLDVDPLLDEQDLLTNFSPVIDKGTLDAPELPEFDFEGESRTIDANNDSVAEPDMGADEAQYYLPNPTVTMTSPEDGESAVPVDINIMIVFSKPMDATTIGDQSITLVPQTTGTVSYNSTTKAATFSLNQGTLGYLTEYTVTVRPTVKDEEGHSLIGAYTWKFTTEEGINPTPTPDPDNEVEGKGCNCGMGGRANLPLSCSIWVGLVILFVVSRTKRRRRR